jgi:hypothetical protein
MSDIVDILVNSMNVGLRESKPKRKDRRGLVFAGMSPANRNVTPLLVQNQRREKGLRDDQAKKSERKEWKE